MSRRSRAWLPNTSSHGSPGTASVCGHACIPPAPSAGRSNLARLGLLESPKDQLVGDTASGEGTRFDPRQEVTVLDVFRDIATVMVRAEPFVEYLHLARFRKSWLTVNAL